MREAASLLAGGWAPPEVPCAPWGAHRTGQDTGQLGTCGGSGQSCPWEGPREGSNLARSEGSRGKKGAAGLPEARKELTCVLRNLPEKPPHSWWRLEAFQPSALQPPPQLWPAEGEQGTCPRQGCWTQ